MDIETKVENRVSGSVHEALRVYTVKKFVRGASRFTRGQGLGERSMGKLRE